MLLGDLLSDVQKKSLYFKTKDFKHKTKDYYDQEYLGYAIKEREGKYDVYSPSERHVAEGIPTVAKAREVVEKMKSTERASDAVDAGKEYVLRKDEEGEQVYEKGGRWYCTKAAWPYSPAAKEGATLETKDTAEQDVARLEKEWADLRRVQKEAEKNDDKETVADLQKEIDELLEKKRGLQQKASGDTADFGVEELLDDILNFAGLNQDADFNEADHPRESDGKFGSGGSGGASKKEKSDWSNKKFAKGTKPKVGERVKITGGPSKGQSGKIIQVDRKNSHGETLVVIKDDKGQYLFESINDVTRDVYTKNKDRVADAMAPGWYVVNGDDRPVDGPMSEKEAKKQAEERSGDYSYSYFSDYAIKRMSEDAKGGSNPKLSVPDWHKLRIAKQTLGMSDVMARIMGGPSKVEARKTYKELTGKEWKDADSAPTYEEYIKEKRHLEEEAADLLRQGEGSSSPAYKLIQQNLKSLEDDYKNSRDAIDDTILIDSEGKKKAIGVSLAQNLVAQRLAKWDESRDALILNTTFKEAGFFDSKDGWDTSIKEKIKELEEAIRVNKKAGNMPNLVAKQEAEIKKLKEDLQYKYDHDSKDVYTKNKDGYGRTVHYKGYDLFESTSIPQKRRGEESWFTNASSSAEFKSLEEAKKFIDKKVGNSKDAAPVEYKGYTIKQSGGEECQIYDKNGEFLVHAENLTEAKQLIDGTVKDAKGDFNPKLSATGWHKLNIAMKTLKMPDAMVGVMGGMTKVEAGKVYEELTGKKWKSGDAATGTKAEEEALKSMRQQLSSAKRNGDSEDVKYYQNAIEELEDKIKHETGDAQCLPKHIGIGGDGFRCTNCGASDKVAGKIKHRTGDERPLTAQDIRQIARGLGFSVQSDKIEEILDELENNPRADEDTIASMLKKFNRG